MACLWSTLFTHLRLSLSTRRHSTAAREEGRQLQLFTYSERSMIEGTNGWTQWAIKLQSMYDRTLPDYHRKQLCLAVCDPGSATFLAWWRKCPGNTWDARTHVLFGHGDMGLQRTKHLAESLPLDSCYSFLR